MKERKIRLALSIISGRNDTNNLDSEEYEILGYDTHKFAYYGTPTRDDILEQAENIIYETLKPNEVHDET